MRAIWLLWLAMAAIPQAASAQDFQLSTRFCIMPVANGVATEADVGAAWRMVSEKFDIPRLPGPVFTPTNRKGAWTIIDRAYQPYQGPFPRTFFDAGNWVVEPWSGLVVATRSFPHGQERGLWVIAPSNNEFVSIALPDGLEADGISAPYLLPRQRQTVVIIGGLPFVVQTTGLTPWMTLEQMTTAGFTGLRSLHYSEAINAILAEDRDGWIHVLSDDGNWKRLNQATDDKTYLSGLFDIEGSGATLLLGRGFVDIVQRVTRNSSFLMERIGTMGLPNTDLLVSSELRQVLRYTGGGLLDSDSRWLRRTAFNYEWIIGGRIGLGEDIYASNLQDLAGMGGAMIRGTKGPYFYDGSAITPIVNDDGIPVVGKAFSRGFPAIHRAMLWKDEQLYDLSHKGVAKPLNHMPIGTGLFDLADWESSGVAVATGDEGIFTIDENLAVERVPGPDFSLHAPLHDGELRATGDMLLIGADRLMLAVDARRHPGVCPVL